MYWKSLISSKFSFLTLSFQSSLCRNDEFFKFFFQISTNLSKFKPSPSISYSIFLCKSPFFFKIWKKKISKIIVRLTRGRKKGRKTELRQTRKILKNFQISSKNKQFSKRNSENFQGFALKFFKFSLNFHSIFKRNFWFLWNPFENWEKLREKKNYPKFIVRLTGEWKKAILEKFWLIFGIIFWGKLTWFFDNFPFYNNSHKIQ